MNFSDPTDSVLVFCTGVRDEDDMAMVEDVLAQFPDVQSWSVDLDDWEKVLRVICKQTQPEDIVIALSNYGVFAREMME